MWGHVTRAPFCLRPARTKRSWFPNVKRKTYSSRLLGVKLQLRVTTAAMRCIDKAGGFDSYVFHTPDHKLDSKLGSYLKEKMKEAVAEKKLEVPPLVKRYPRLPRSLQIGAKTEDQTLSPSPPPPPIS